MNPKISLRLVVIFRPLRLKGAFFQSLTKKIGENVFILKIKNHTDEFDFNYFQFNKNKMRKNNSRNPKSNHLNFYSLKPVLLSNNSPKKIMPSPQDKKFFIWNNKVLFPIH